MSLENPILNNPYEAPDQHYKIASDGTIDYTDIRKGRAIFRPEIPAVPKKTDEQKEIWEVNDFSAQYGTELVNLIRQEVGKWRGDNYNEFKQVTRVTKELLTYWFLNSDKLATQRLFFAQREAIETAIWLNEVASSSGVGTHILNNLREAQLISPYEENNLPRVAFKMATGTGKTVVMAALILYHYLNKQEYRNETSFADYFLIVAPGITIRDRLNVLYVDTATDSTTQASDYYRQRDLVPPQFNDILPNINAHLVILNYDKFRLKVLQGNKKSPFDNKTDLRGNTLVATEDYSQMIKHVMGGIKSGSRLIIINDEAHHCYLPNDQANPEDDEEREENVRASLWFKGIQEICRRYKVKNIYDLSATPYFLHGSGYTAYSLFPWTVSDFGLVEAIESGLVKIPFLPEKDATHNIDEPVLMRLYEHVKDKLPKKGQRRLKSDARKEGVSQTEGMPQVPDLIKSAIDQFYKDYEDYYQGLRKQQEEKASLFTSPPVFIVVCNNTTVSKEVYRFIAGWDERDKDGKLVRVETGYCEMFSNYDPVTKRAKSRPPTLLIDTSALEAGDQVNEEFRKVFSTEIDEFRQEYRRIKGAGAALKISDTEILREVVNTVGKPGMLGAHIRCVVSVSMLTEGWDANTVTHILGIRKFGSNLLCEQVAGRALRRMNYFLQGYDKEGNPTNDKRKVVIEKFPPEYARIIGVPFKMFKGGKTILPPRPEYTSVHALPERRKDYEIKFPNMEGYRVEYDHERLSHDFSALPNFEIDFTKVPYYTILGNAVSSQQIKMELDKVVKMRDQEIVYKLTQMMLRYKYCDADRIPRFQLFNQLKQITEDWYKTKIVLRNKEGDDYKRLIYFYDMAVVCDEIDKGINTHINTSEYIRPVFKYDKFGSTKYVNGHTSKPEEKLYPTAHSHVNFVVADTDSWEQICAKTLEELAEEKIVKSYVKNSFLNFTIPYVKDGMERQYFPDFIAQCRTETCGEFNLIIEITGMNKDKEEKRWYLNNRWLPAVNAVREQYKYGPWFFAEISGDIKDIKIQLGSVMQNIAGRIEKAQRILQAAYSASGVDLKPEMLRREFLYGDDER